MSNSADHTMEVEPLKGQPEETDGPNGQGCTGKMGVTKLSGCRTAVFLFSMFLCLTVVFAFSFILPCPVRPQYLSAWNLTIPAAVTYNFLAIGDASEDKVLDVFLIFKSSEGVMNHTCTGEGLLSPCLFLLALDGTDGHVLWERPLAAEFDWAECGLDVGGKGPKLCVVAHADNFTSIDMHKGKILRQVPRPIDANGNLPVISLPGLKDIAMLSYSTTDASSVVGLIFSGKWGNMTAFENDEGVALGQMRSHLRFMTASEAQYVLLHTDTGLYAVSLGRLLESAEAGLDSKLKKDESWERRANNKGLITLYNSASLQSVLKVRGSYSSSSPSLLLQTDSTVMLFDTRKLRVTWTTNTSNLVSTPSFGHFNKDGVPDIMLEEDQGNNIKRVVILDGKKGSVLWEVIMPFRFNNPQPASILTLNNHYSVFMLWGQSHTHTNDTSLEVEERSSYLLYPLKSDFLLERRNPAQHIIAFKALLLERGRHASYFVLTGEDGALNRGVVLDEAKSVILTKRKIKGDVSESSVLRVGAAGRLEADASVEEESVKETFYRLRFSDQAQ
ncbi:protein FAM234A [Neoarius graeffei]|uniref:protein FAM234A n=1 Tax=Neoarius graeffei TaxID=443677 RepID=UPI00298CFB36|nr:protein FAM234A [Neoarius graeffei]